MRALSSVTSCYTTAQATARAGGLALLCLAATSAWADPSPALDRFSLSAGGFYADPRVQIDANTSNGRVSTPSDDLSHATLPRVKAEMLLGDTQGLSLDYYRYDKSYNPTVSGSGDANGLPLSGTATLNGNLKLDLAQLAYKWWLGHGNDVFGIGAGAAYYRAELSGTVNGSLNGVTGSASASTSDSTYAPLLELGWRHAFSSDVRLYADASGVKKSGGRVNGHIYGGDLGVEWFLAKNVGLTADYAVSKITINRDGDNSDNLDVRLSGPSVFLKLRF